MGLNLTLGYAGQISLAQAAFMGIGAYTTAILTTGRLAAGSSPSPLAVLLCFVVGWLLGYPALRVQHHYLAFVTLAFSTLVFLVLRNEEWLTGGVFGLVEHPAPEPSSASRRRRLAFYYFTLVVVARRSRSRCWWLIRSPWGRAFMALRENPMRAASLGVDTRALHAARLRHRLGLWRPRRRALRAARRVHRSDALRARRTRSDLLLMVVVGGAGFFFGPFLGALLVVAAAGVAALHRGLLPDHLRRRSSWCC